MATHPQREQLIRRHTIRLILAQVLLWASLGVWARLAPIQADELTGRQSAAGLAVALYYIAAGLGARITGWRMDRQGRRFGLLLSYLLFGIGGLASFSAVELRSAGFLLADTFVIGLGAGGALLGRAAVADMYPAERRGRAVGTLVVAGAVGAVGGPFLASGLTDGVGAAAAWLAVPALCALAIVSIWGLKPDPRELAADTGARASTGSTSSGILRTRPGFAAVTAIGASQAVMATFMAIVPVVLNREHAAHGTISSVVSLHLGAMFFFSPFIGGILDRRGRRIGLLGGLALTGAGVALCAFPSGTAASAIGLVFVGVGWSGGYLGSTALVSDLASPAERARALGRTDLVASLSAAVGVLAGARLVEANGVGSLGWVALVLLLAPVLLVALLREPSPGRWETEPAA